MASEGKKQTKLNGELFLYNEDYGYAAFEAGPGEAGPGDGHLENHDWRSSRKALVCIPGLTDGLLSLRYLPVLAARAQREGWRVIQPVLSSSYGGWGTASLDGDVAEIDRLLDFLSERRGIYEVALLGHSTGCQDVVRYLSKGKQVDMVRGAILQAPVSDREALQVSCAELGAGAEEKLQKYKALAAEMIADGNGEEVMPRAASELLGPPHAVTAYRFASLTGRMTDDDMFSSDLTDGELREKLGHVAIPTIVAASVDDEYVPKGVDVPKLAARLADAMAASPCGLVRTLLLDKAGHSLRQPEAAAEFSEAVGDFLGKLHGMPRLAWEGEVVRDLHRRAAAAAQPGRPYVVALAGMPGSGKTTSAMTLERLLGPSCLVVPMDGYHLPLEALKGLPDAEEAVYRRGAPDTFDPAALRAALGQVRDAAGPAEVLMPGFDRAAGDPAPRQHRFDRAQHKIVIVEGLYLLHDGDGWERLADAFDYKMYLDADLEACVARVKERNKCIPGYTQEEIEIRCEKVDRANALVVRQSARSADIMVISGAD